MNILVHISTRTELIASAIAALVCHAALFGFLSGNGEPASQASAEPDLQVTMVSTEELVTREPLPEPIREKEALPSREKVAAPVRESITPAPRTRVSEERRTVREPVREKERKIRPEERREVETPRRKIEQPRREKVAVAQEKPARGTDLSRPARILNREEFGRLLNEEYTRLAAFRKGFQGKVVLKLLVSAKGEGKEVSPIPAVSSGFKTLDSGAVRIVDRLKKEFLCKPALDKKGRATEGWIEQTFTFSIEDGE